jgi:hypothetical protein
MNAVVEIIYVPMWRAQIWDDDVPSRPGWFVTCSECGQITEEGWTYENHARAAQVATRHRRAYHGVSE